MRKLIGYCGVDSGQILLIDPCYLGGWKDGEFTAEEGTKPEQAKNNYEECCLVTENQGGQVFNKLAVVSVTGWGDGYYPVYANINEDGRVSSVTIKFT